MKKYSPQRIWRKYRQPMLMTLSVLVVVSAIGVLTTTSMDRSYTQAEDNPATTTAVDTSPEVVATTSSSHSTSDSATTSVAQTSTTSSETSKPVDPYDVSVNAKSAIVLNATNDQVLFSKRPDKERALASLTKLMTALVGAEKADEVEGGEVEISRQHLNAEGSSGLVAGQSWNIQDLISFMLIESSNDAARAVAAASSADQADGYAQDFIDSMNQTAETLSLSTTYFFNPSGLDLNETLISGGYGSARDAARLFAHILETNQSVLAPTTETYRSFSSVEGVSYTAENTNTKLSEFSSVLGSKTGYTVLAGGNLVMGFDLKQPVVIAILGSTRDGRFTDMKTLYEATRTYLDQQAAINSIN